MSLSETKETNFWVENVLESQSAAGIIAYLEAVTGKSVMITDIQGKVYAHSSEIEMKSADDHYLELPQHSKERLQIDEATNSIYYFTGFTEKDACIIIRGTPDKEALAEWESHLSRVSVGVKVYVSLTQEKEKIKNQFTHQLLEDILVRSVCNIKEIVKQYASVLDLNKLYYVAVLEPEPISEKELIILHGHSKEWLKHHGLDIICSIWKNKFLVFVCPTHFDEQTLEADQGWSRHLNNIRKHQKDIMNRFGIATSFGVGRKYPLPELHKSYQEALIALNISKLTGKKNFVKHYNDLGIFSIINYADTELLSNFTSSTISKLLEYDSLNRGELVATLKTLFDTGFDLKEAAQRLYIHSNTLRYRIKKIEELTGMRLDRPEDQLNLFAALKLHELHKKLYS
ncbi:MAG: PucR family transcriptional regulator [Thermacetogeniaceae bacterium]